MGQTKLESDVAFLRSKTVADCIICYAYRSICAILVCKLLMRASLRHFSEVQPVL